MKNLVFQHTLSDTLSVSGVGLHSGKPIKVNIFPSAANTGLVFKRVDLDGNPSIPLSGKMVKPTPLCTTLYNEDGISISTIEHLLAAFSSVGIDNAIIEVNGAEIPILDGSSSPWLYLIREAGIRFLSAKRTFLRVDKFVEVKEGDKYARLTPASDLIIDFTIDFNHPTIMDSSQSLRTKITPQSFRAISNARTFGFINDIEALRAQGLILGGSMDNAIVLDKFNILNQEGLRHDDEFVRHKILDAVGDLYAEGKIILGEMTAFKSGHSLNNALLTKAIEQNAFTEVSIELDQPVTESSIFLENYLFA